MLKRITGMEIGDFSVSIWEDSGVYFLVNTKTNKVNEYETLDKLLQDYIMCIHRLTELTAVN